MIVAKTKTTHSRAFNFTSSSRNTPLPCRITETKPAKPFAYITSAKPRIARTTVEYVLESVLRCCDHESVTLTSKFVLPPAFAVDAHPYSFFRNTDFLPMSAVRAWVVLSPVSHIKFPLLAVFANGRPGNFYWSIQMSLACHFLPHSGQIRISPTFAFLIFCPGWKEQKEPLHLTSTFVFMVLHIKCL